MKLIVKIMLLWPMYFLIGFFSRNKKIWCFGSYKNKFNDNTKYAYIKCSYKYPDVKCYWVTDDNELITELSKIGLHAVKRRSLRGLYIMSRACVYFVSSYTTDIFFWTSNRCYYVNLWHGLPLKKIEYDIDNGPLCDKYNSNSVIKKFLYKVKEPECFKQPNLMFAPSDFWVNILSKAFNIGSERFIRCGSPRTDVFFEKKLTRLNDVNYEEKFHLKLKAKQFKNILLMPTFRDSGVDYFQMAKFNFGIMEEFLRYNSCQLYVKLHPSDNHSKAIDFSIYKHIHLISEEIDDIYPYLSAFDLLITDYSSIYLDYILLNKEILFYCFDLNDYMLNSRSLYFNYEEFTPGYKARDFEQLMSRINDFVVKDIRYDRTVFISEYFSSDDSYINSDAIYEHVRKVHS
ncbi:CDP-glycerol glycerophosphotransferase family protein [Buttiauxella sp. A111]|uniref:CDP-glycerol glycerophosphotransferase family protein n=1 Tax=Buttiauxella sp. A111 TaxID=2563088 RepID=UPI0010E09303|nr:CDP-glycerol glycerophosphotransferase family protein [Buttiauxella sp. A111]GDX07042.1 hypothetical protein BSPA111_32560 [Buttiauxella sp. A111]